ncbi:hypothetical protein [Aeromicrobium sp. Leaf350]|uniref:hypothetical protein n=1 Tax=Aeromicrobium sp. Leaf350 TaxID=2876565 RepID=UPI001E4FCA33|nr:hypothetical protein [Aeromicrobium sp. Leaf350]
MILPACSLLLRRRHAAVLGAVALGLAACGTETDADDDTAATAAEPVEVDHAEPRLVVAYPDHVEFFDATTIESLGTVETDSAVYVQTAADGRHVFTLAHQDEKIGLVDSGTWTEAHGDHGHSFTLDPSSTALDLDGLSYHAVSDDERSVIWFDDLGAFGVLDHDELEGGTIEPQMFEVGEPHHGVAVPTADGGFLASVSADGEATGVAVLDATGAETNRFETCPGLHGESHVGETGYAFGCGTGILVVDGGQATSIPSPVEGAGTGTLASDHESTIVAGALSAEDRPELGSQLALYDTATGASRAVELGAPFSNLVVSEGRAIVVGTDGALRVVDLASGEVTTVPAIAEWEKTDDWQEPRPYLAVAGDTVWITDPQAGAIHTLDLATSALETTEVEGGPGRLVVVNADHAGHSH